MPRIVQLSNAPLLILFLAVTALGQATTGGLVVTVTDQTGGPIPAVTVTLEPQEAAAGGITSATANDDGVVEFANIAPGEYRVKASDITGFKTADNYFLAVVEITKFLDLVLESKAATLIHVPDIPIRGEFSKPTGTILTEFDDPLPSSLNIRGLLDIAPSTRLEPLAAGISIDGSTGPDTTYFIDGQEVTNPTTGILNRNHNLPFTILQEVSVNSGAERAEFGGSIGGVVNVVTKGGNDRLRGDVGFSIAPSGLNGGNRPIIYRYGLATGEFEYFQPESDRSESYFPYGSLSGPFIKEKLWFLGSYSPQFFENKRIIDYYDTTAPGRNLNQTIEYDQDLRQEFAFIRLDTHPVKTVSGTLSFLWNPTIQNGLLPPVEEGLSGVPQTAFGLTGAELSAKKGGRNNSNLVNGSVNWTPISGLFVNLRAGRGFLNEKLGSYGPIDQTRYACSTLGTPQNVPGSNCSSGFNTGSNYANRLNENTRTTASVDGGLVGITAVGRHNIGIGYQYDQIERKVDEGYLENGYIVLYYGRSIAEIPFVSLPATGNQCDYTNNPDPTGCWVGSGFMQRFGYQANLKGSNHAFYAQDNWQIGGRVTINAGFRFENEKVPPYGNFPGDRAQVGYETIKFDWNDKISPRFGAAVDLFGNGKTRLFGSYFWNYDRLKNNAIEENGEIQFARDYFEIFPERGVAYIDYNYDNILGGETDFRDFRCEIVSAPGYSRCRRGLVITNIPEVPPPLPRVDSDIKPTKQIVLIFGVNQDLGAGLSLHARYVRKELENVIEDVGVFNDQGSERYLVTNPGNGITCEIARAFHPCSVPERKYDAVEVGVEKVLFNVFFNANYTWSRLYGNYSGLASSEERGRVEPNGTRTFDLPFEAFTANGVPNNGRLATDRPHVFKGFGGYRHRWSNGQITEISGFTTAQSGTPLTTVYTLLNVQTAILFGRGDLGRTELFTETDLRIGHKFDFGREGRYRFEAYSEILNVFDESNELSGQTSISSTNFRPQQIVAGGCTTCQNDVLVVDTIFSFGGIQQYVLNYLNAQGVNGNGYRNDYNQPNRFQAPRSVRFGIRFVF